MNQLFDGNLITNIDSILEWAHPGRAFDYSECYEDMEEGQVKGIIPFVNWPQGFSRKEAYVNERREAWTTLKNAITDHNAQGSRGAMNWRIPKKKRTVRGRNRG